MLISKEFEREREVWGDTGSSFLISSQLRPQLLLFFQLTKAAGGRTEGKTLWQDPAGYQSYRSMEKLS